MSGSIQSRTSNARGSDVDRFDRCERGRRRRRVGSQDSRQRPQRDPVLEGSDVDHVVVVEELRAHEHEQQLGRAAEQPHAGGRRARPSGAGDGGQAQRAARRLADSVDERRDLLLGAVRGGAVAVDRLADRALADLLDDLGRVVGQRADAVDDGRERERDDERERQQCGADDDQRGDAASDAHPPREGFHRWIEHRGEEDRQEQHEQDGADLDEGPRERG
jgi:hypothetical protein